MLRECGLARYEERAKYGVKIAIKQGDIIKKCTMLLI